MAGKPKQLGPQFDTDTAPINAGTSPRTSALSNSFSNSAYTSGADTAANQDGQPILGRRRSVAERMSAIGDFGGHNSFNNFARSWQRAAGFYHIARRSSQDTTVDDMAADIEGGYMPQRPALREALNNEAPADPHEEAIEDTEPGSTNHQAREDNIFNVQRDLGSALNNYGTLSSNLGSRLSEPARVEAGKLFRQQQEGLTQPERDREPLLAKQTEDDKAMEFVGQSTVQQTVFNSVNTLIGVGMLSLPLAIKLSGWVFGLLFFIFSAFSTSYAARLLGKCLDTDPSLLTFGDLAYVSFGRKARVAVSLLFSLELFAACVAMVILFADSIESLIPGWGLLELKLVCGLVLIPLVFLPLRLLSFTSVLGIMCCLAIVALVTIAGIIKPTAPGSLREVAATYAVPADWRTMPLAFGLLMSPWGGHSVFPNIYRDMRHPEKYGFAVFFTYIITVVIMGTLAIVGYLMYGDNVLDEITTNIFQTEGHPKWISLAIIVAVAIIPLTKTPLIIRPIISTFEIYLGLDPRSLSSNSKIAGLSALTRGILRATIRVGMVAAVVAISAIVPSFDKVMSLLGSFACFTICLILPCLFHLRLYGKEMSRRQKALDWFLVIFSVICGTAGTVCSFLPKRFLGMEQ